MRFFRESSLEQLPVSIAGIKLGDRVIMLGCSDPKLIAQLAVKTGLTGRACAVDEDARRVERAADVAPREGALIESATVQWTSLPYDNLAFDVAIVRDVFGTLDASARSGAVAELVRVLRPGGRCLVIDSAPRGGIGGLLAKKSAPADYDAVRTLETGAFRAVRLVAEREGLRFVEGVKENVP
jgi:demethylmenaquinone methyltransferase/2-methoxy-6-polyprenyl-1,4-benzoquinol methylase